MPLLQARRALAESRPTLPRTVRFFVTVLTIALLAISSAAVAVADSTPGGKAAPGASAAAGTSSSARGAFPVGEFPSRQDQVQPNAAARTDGLSSRGGARSSSQSSLADWQTAFIETAGAAAQETQAATGVPASVTVAQAIIESDWGRNTIKDGNNYFGIKATSGPGPAGVVWAQTQEFLNGVWVTIQAPFRAYNSMAESFEDHGQFLLENKRYAPALAVKDDPKAFALALQRAGYATAPNYAQALIALMDRHDLYRFDLPSDQSPSDEASAATGQ